MSAPSDPTRDQQLVTLARQLERHLARRRKLRAQLVELSDDIERARDLIRTMTAAEPRLPFEAGELPEPSAGAGEPLLDRALPPAVQRLATVGGYPPNTAEEL